MRQLYVYILKIFTIDAEGNISDAEAESSTNILKPPLSLSRPARHLSLLVLPSVLQVCSFVFTLSTLSSMVCSLSVRVPTLMELVSLGTPIW